MRNRWRQPLTGALGACILFSVAAMAAAEQATSSTRPDFSGQWVRDHERSERWDQVLHAAVNQLQREAGLRQRQQQGGTAILGDARRQARILMSKARLAETITAQELLRVVQDDAQIRIEREHDAPLVCGTEADTQQVFDSTHGRETCHWEQERLRFDIRLPEAVTISHRFSLDPDQTSLRVETRVSSRQSPSFELRRVYLREDGATTAFDCAQTLTRGRVCQLREVEPP